MNQKLLILVRADCIPLGSVVTKRTGTYEYVLTDRVRVFSEKGVPQEIAAVDGARFLCGHRGDANVVSGSKLLLWATDLSELRVWIDEKLDGPMQ